MQGLNLLLAVTTGVIIFTMSISRETPGSFHFMLLPTDIRLTIYDYIVATEPRQVSPLTPSTPFAYSQNVSSWVHDFRSLFFSLSTDVRNYLGVSQEIRFELLKRYTRSAKTIWTAKYYQDMGGSVRTYKLVAPWLTLPWDGMLGWERGCIRTVCLRLDYPRLSPGSPWTFEYAYVRISLLAAGPHCRVGVCYKGLSPTSGIAGHGWNNWKRYLMGLTHELHDFAFAAVCWKVGNNGREGIRFQSVDWRDVLEAVCGEFKRLLEFRDKIQY
jgi:hypothetical protein